MNEIDKKPPALFTPSGCITGEALMLFVSGSLEGKELEQAERHIADCPLCADAADGLKMWLNENASTPSSAKSGDSAAAYLPDQKPSDRVFKPIPNRTQTDLFQKRTGIINERIKKRLHTYSGHESGTEKQLSYKPYMWLAAAATLVLFIGGFYMLWVQNPFDSQKMAQKREKDALLRTGTYDSLPFPPSESKSVLTINYSNTKGADRPPVLALMNETAPPVASDIVVSNARTVSDTDDDLNILRDPTESDEMNDWIGASKKHSANRQYSTKHTGGAMSKPETDGESGTVYTLVEQMPSFPGGDVARVKYFARNLRYPPQAAEEGIQGIVYVSFVVKTNGSLSEISILRGIGGGCDQEVLRVLKKMPNWQAGYKNGKKVDVRYNMPITFKLK